MTTPHKTLRGFYSQNILMGVVCVGASIIAAAPDYLNNKNRLVIYYLPNTTQQQQKMYLSLTTKHKFNCSQSLKSTT